MSFDIELGWWNLHVRGWNEGLFEQELDGIGRSRAFKQIVKIKGGTGRL